MSTEILHVTPDTLRQMVDQFVEEKLALLFHDPEDDLELTDELKQILARQDKRIKNGDYGEPLEDVAARLGLS